MVVFVLPEVFRKFEDPCCQDRHLDFCRTFVGIVSLVFLDYRRFCRLVQVVGISWRLRNSNYRIALYKENLAGRLIFSWALVNEFRVA